MLVTRRQSSAPRSAWGEERTRTTNQEEDGGCTVLDETMCPFSAREFAGNFLSACFEL